MREAIGAASKEDVEELIKETNDMKRVIVSLNNEIESNRRRTWMLLALILFQIIINTIVNLYIWVE